MAMIIPELTELVPVEHEYRKLLGLLDFEGLCRPLEKLYSHTGRSGYPVATGFKSLLLQFMLDLSDRQMERYLSENLAGKYFCGFGLMEQTPDHSYFCKFRERLGTKRLAELFNTVKTGLKEKGYVREIYTFVDATSLNARVDTWRARDKAIEDVNNEERNDDDKPTMNNRNAKEYSSDPDARYGCKGKNKLWFGFKRHVAVDMHQGFITKIAVTPANVHDGKALKHVVPRQGAVIADKAYSGRSAQGTLKARALHSMCIQPNNRKDKNRDKDRFFSSLRMPYEGVFSKLTKKSRYVGLKKNQFQAFMEAFSVNFKRMLAIDAEPIPIFA